MTKWICVLLFSLSVWGVQARQVDFEHSFFRAEGTIWGIEGTIWGIEGTLAKKLDLPEDQIPSLYKQSLERPQPELRTVDSSLFFNGQAVLYKNLRLCVDPNLGINLQELQVGIQEWSQYFSKPDQGVSHFQIQLESWSPSLTKTCDVLVVRGEKNKFPFAHLPANSKSPSEKYWENRVFALFYRYSDLSLPVVTVDPDIQLISDPHFARYTALRENQILVNAQILLLHELGHVLGFEHLNKTKAEAIDPNFTVMGEANGVRSEEEVQARFEKSENLWLFWDQRQLSAYRKALWASGPIKTDRACYVPGDHLMIYWNSPFLTKDYPQLLGKNHFQRMNQNSLATTLLPEEVSRLFSYVDQENFYYKVDDLFYLTIASHNKDLPLKPESIGVIPYNDRIRFFLIYEVASIKAVQPFNDLRGVLNFVAPNPRGPHGITLRKYDQNFPLNFDLAPTPAECP